MALSDCEKCWDTPCTCGFEWEHYTTEQLQKARDMLDKILKRREAGEEPRKRTR